MDGDEFVIHCPEMNVICMRNASKVLYSILQRMWSLKVRLGKGNGFFFFRLYCLEPRRVRGPAGVGAHWAPHRVRTPGIRVPQG